METQVVQQPMIIIALSPREAKAALEDPEQLQAAIRREWLSTQSVEPLALAALNSGALPERAPTHKPRGKMGGAKHVKPKAKQDPAGQFPCPHCDAVRKTRGFLARHIRQVHPETATTTVDDDE